LANSFKENLFRFGTLIGSSIMVACGDWTQAATIGAVSSEILKGLGINLGSESISGLLKSGYNYVTNNQSNQVVNHHIQKTLLAAWRESLENISKEYLRENKDVDEKSLKAFVADMGDINEENFLFGVTESADKELIFGIVSGDPQNFEEKLIEKTKLENGLKPWMELYSLTENFEKFFFDKICNELANNFRRLANEGQESANAMNLIYAESSRQALELIISSNVDISNRVKGIEKTTEAILEKLNGIPLPNQYDSAVKAWNEQGYTQINALLHLIDPQPSLESWELTKRDDKDDVFRKRAIELYGREEEMLALKTFYESPDSFAWWMLTGEAGSGKSRLALEFCIQLSQQTEKIVHAGFASSALVKKYSWEERTPEYDWFIVLDYAGADQKIVEEMIQHFQAKSNSIRKKIRLLLIDRSIPSDWWDSTEKRIRIKGGYSICYSNDSLNLSNVESELREDIVRSIFKEVIQEEGIQNDNLEEADNFIENLRKIDPQLRPLFAYYSAVAVKNGKNIRDWNLNRLLQYRLDDHEKKRWSSVIADGEKLRKYMYLLAYATMVKGISYDVLDRMCEMELPWFPNSDADEVLKVYRNIHIVDDEKKLKEIEPDIYGEFIVATILNEGSSSKAIRIKNDIIQLAWKLQPEGILSFSKLHFEDYGDDKLLQDIINAQNNWTEEHKLQRERLSQLLLFIGRNYKERSDQSFFERGEKVLKNASELYSCFDTHFELALYYQFFNDFENAKKSYYTCLELFTDDYEKSSVLNNLANLLRAQNDYETSRVYFEESLSIRRRLAETNPQTYLAYVGTTLNNLAILLRAQNDYETSRVYYEESLSIYRRLAETNPQTYLAYVGTTLNNLAILLSDQNDYETSRVYNEESLSIYRRLAETNPQTYLPDVAMTLNNLAILLRSQKDYETSRVYYEESLSIRRRLAETNPQTYLPYVGTTLNNLAILLSDQNDYKTSQIYYEESLSIYRRLAETNPQTYLPDVAMTLNNLAILLRAQNDYDTSRVYYEESLSIYTPCRYLPDALISGEYARFSTINPRFITRKASILPKH
jgi:hypothetical protein